MKKLFLISFGCILAVCGGDSLQGEIVETNEIMTVLNHVNKDSFLFLNVTGTMYEPSNELSDHRWREYFSERVQELVEDPKIAQILIDDTKNWIVQNIPKSVVEDKTPQLIAELQAKKIAVLGITQKQVTPSYAENFASITQKHLRSLGIHLERSLDFLKIKGDKGDQTGYTFVDGILFTNKNPVGPALVEFLNSVEPKSSRVVAVDNSRSSLDSMQKSMNDAGIKFVGLCYGRADAQKKVFDPILGIIEFCVFINEGKIISDEEAHELKLSQPHFNFEELLDDFICTRSEELQESSAF